jgi:hypothetical protein
MGRWIAPVLEPCRVTREEAIAFGTVRVGVDVVLFEVSLRGERLVAVLAVVMIVGSVREQVVFIVEVHVTECTEVVPRGIGPMLPMTRVNR